MAAMLFTILELGGAIVWTVYHLVEAGVKLLIPDKVMMMITVNMMMMATTATMMMMMMMMTRYGGRTDGLPSC